MCPLIRKRILCMKHHQHTFFGLLLSLALCSQLCHGQDIGGMQQMQELESLRELQDLSSLQQLPQLRDLQQLRNLDITYREQLRNTLTLPGGAENLEHFKLPGLGPNLLNPSSPFLVFLGRNHRPVDGSGITPSTKAEAKLLAPHNIFAKNFSAAIDSEAAENCADAVSALRDFETATRLEKYRAACALEGLADIKKFGLTDAQQTQLARSVGYFSLAGKAPFCTGVLVGKSIFTARHCVELVGGSLANVNFTFYDRKLSPLKGFQVKDNACDSIHANLKSSTFQACDYIELSPTKPCHESTLEFSESADSFLPILIPAYNKNFHLAIQGLSPRTEAQSNSDWASGISWTDHPFCSINKIIETKVRKGGETTEKHCYRHACQTLGGASGAPIFALKEGVLNLVGLHIGSTWHPSDKESPWQDTNICSAADTELAKSSNLGIQVP